MAHTHTHTQTHTYAHIFISKCRLHWNGLKQKCYISIVCRLLVITTCQTPQIVQGRRSSNIATVTVQNLKRVVTQTIRTDVQNGRPTQQPRNAKPQLVPAATITQLNVRPQLEVVLVTIAIARQLVDVFQEAHSIGTIHTASKKKSNAEYRRN